MPACALDIVNRILNPDYVQDVRGSFERQAAMQLIRATMPFLEAGCAEIHVEHWDGIERQSGYIHGGIVGMIVESAANHAAMTLVGRHSAVATVEMKLSLMSPVVGDRLIARGHVTRSGRTAFFTEVDVFAIVESEEHLCATAELTGMVVDRAANADT